MTAARSSIAPSGDPRLRPSEAMLYWASFVGQHYLRIPLLGRIRNRIATRLAQRGLPERGTIQIPTLDPALVTPEAYRRDYLKRNIPVVLKGAAAGWPAVQKWTPEFLSSQYGTERVCVRFKTKSIDVESICRRDMTLSEVIDNIRNGGEYYASNLEDLFNDNPELRNDLSLRELERYSSLRQLPPAAERQWRFPRSGEIISTQIFMSNANGRTGYHCESGGNLFVQVYGRKHWVLVHPQHTPFMYPVIRKDFFYSASPIDHDKSANALSDEGYGLYNVIPKYEVVLDPGDVLLSPQWWWHTVNNLDLSIGVSLRFPTALFAGHPLFSCMTVLSPSFLRHYLHIARTGWGADATAARRLFEPEGVLAKVQLSSSTPPRVKSTSAGH